jgi:hypothetical protein
MLFSRPGRERIGRDDIICGLGGEGCCVRKLHEYREHAAECREMARTAPPAHRQQLEQMASTWEQLAVARQRKLLKSGASGDRFDDEK